MGRLPVYCAGASVGELACSKAASSSSEATAHMLVTMVTEYSRATCLLTLAGLLLVTWLLWVTYCSKVLHFVDFASALTRNCRRVVWHVYALSLCSKIGVTLVKLAETGVVSGLVSAAGWELKIACTCNMLCMFVDLDRICWRRSIIPAALLQGNQLTQKPVVTKHRQG